MACVSLEDKETLDKIIELQDKGFILPLDCDEQLQDKLYQLADSLGLRTDVLQSLILELAVEDSRLESKIIKHVDRLKMAMA